MSDGQRVDYYSKSKNAYNRGEYILALYYLYRSLKESEAHPTHINEMRVSILGLLELEELELLVLENIHIGDFKYNQRRMILLQTNKSKEFIDNFRLLLLYQYNNFPEWFYTAFFNLLKQSNKDNELHFWLNYLLFHESNHISVIKHKVLSFYQEHKYEDIIECVDDIKHSSLLTTIKIYALIHLGRFNDAKEIIDNSTQIRYITKHLALLKIAEEQFRIDKNTIEEFKRLYAIGIDRTYPKEFHLLAHSPYINSYLCKEIDTIYHYTDVFGIKGIVQCGEIWATKNDYLNDYKEQVFLIDVLDSISCELDDIDVEDVKNSIQRYFDAILYKDNKSNSNRYLNEFIDNVILKDYFNEIYLASFSSNADNLTLWKNYSSYSGYNIGINKKELMDSLRFTEDMHYNYVFEGYVRYLSGEERSVIVRKLINEIYSDLIVNQIDKKIIKEVIIAHLLIISNFIKDITMKQEQEYRILFVKASKDSIVNKNSLSADINSLNSQSRIKGYSIIPYIKVPINISSSLEIITLGPTNNMDIAKKGVIDLLEKIGFKGCTRRVKESIITLRY